MIPPSPKTYVRRLVASAGMDATPPGESQPARATPYVVVALNADGQPDRALLIFPTAADADAHARHHQIGDYRVVPAYFSHVNPRRGT
ncbi:hypothetical protein [Frankia sp. Cr2]|uniref:hypothetical protein n=1 Tax=Frankia sp. Cr2 TaxID=3073932 RepID=UPI002AD28E03|nr:hypothetical protein [Frankia sp. Cr2]